MINGIIAGAAGATVETLVRESPKPNEAETMPAPAEADKAEQATAIGEAFIEMRDGLIQGDWEKAKGAYEQVLQVTRAKGRRDTEVFCNSLYHRERFFGGQAAALDELRRLAAAESTNPFPKAVPLAQALPSRRQDQARETSQGIS